MSLPKFLQPYLASYNIKQMDRNDSWVKKEVITQVLNLGDDKAVCWLFKNYKDTEIINMLRQPRRGTWFRKSLNYWSTILGVKISPSLYQEAVLNLNKFAHAPRNSKSKSG